MVDQQNLYKFICKCGRSIMVLGKDTQLRCECGKKMVREDELHPLEVYRYKNKLSQIELAAKLKVDKTYISKIENNSIDIPMELKVKIKRLTGIIL